MTDVRPRTDAEWEQFRFPKAFNRPGEAPASPGTPAVLPVAELASSSEDDEETESTGGEEGTAGQGTGELEPQVPPLSVDWVFVPESSSLRSEGLKKQVALADLNTASKIIRLLAVFRLRTDLEPDSFSRALEAACQHRFNQSVEELIKDKDYRNDAAIPWTPVKVPSTRPAGP